MPKQFDHEKLNVYHEAVLFVGGATTLLERVPKRLAVYDQLDRDRQLFRSILLKDRGSSPVPIVVVIMTPLEAPLSSALHVSMFWS